MDNKFLKMSCTIDLIVAFLEPVNKTALMDPNNDNHGNIQINAFPPAVISIPFQSFYRYV